MVQAPFISVLRFCRGQPLVTRFPLSNGTTTNQVLIHTLVKPFISTVFSKVTLKTLLEGMRSPIRWPSVGQRERGLQDYVSKVRIVTTSVQFGSNSHLGYVFSHVSVLITSLDPETGDRLRLGLQMRWISEDQYPRIIKGITSSIKFPIDQNRMVSSINRGETFPRSLRVSFCVEYFDSVLYFFLSSIQAFRCQLSDERVLWNLGLWSDLFTW